MSFNQFNFAEINWLWGLTLIPLFWLVLSVRKPVSKKSARLERFADRHLLEHLLVNGSVKSWRSWRSPVMWSVIWGLGVLALAGPRWSFTEVKTYKPSQSLVLLLDLSKSMDARDAKPSRLILAREKIQDLIDISAGVNIGLVAFAEDSHIVTPITEDKKALHNVLGELSTSLVAVQGSRLTPALGLAGQLLDAMPGKEKSILILSDEGFEDAPLREVRQLKDKGITIDTMGFGSLEGAPIPNDHGGWAAENDQVEISKLNVPSLKAISAEGGGHYLSAQMPVTELSLFNGSIASRGSDPTNSEQTTKDWEPRFYVFLFPLMLMLLPLFRRRTSSISASSQAIKVACVVLFSALTLPTVARVAALGPAAEAASTRASDSMAERLFENKAMRGKQELDRQHYNEAVGKFDDPYRRGVAEYRAGDFVKAEQDFSQSKRGEVQSRKCVGQTRKVRGGGKGLRSRFKIGSPA